MGRTTGKEQRVKKVEGGFENLGRLFERQDMSSYKREEKGRRS